MLQYFIKWKGYPKSDNTWEPADQIHAPELLKAYYRQNPLDSIKARQAQAEEVCPVPYSIFTSLTSNLENPFVTGSLAGTYNEYWACQYYDGERAHDGGLCDCLTSPSGNLLMD